jgi:hypothetical protein
MIIPINVQQLFVRLGWSHEDVAQNLRQDIRIRSTTATSKYFRGVRAGKYFVHDTKIVLACDHYDAIGSERIRPVTIDLSAPNWEKRIFAWDMATTFKLTNLAAKNCQRDHDRQLKLGRQKEAYAEATSLHPDLVSARTDYETGALVGFLVQHSIGSHITGNITPLTIDEQRSKITKLLNYLKAEGLITK